MSDQQIFELPSFLSAYNGTYLGMQLTIKSGVKHYPMQIEFGWDQLDLDLEEKSGQHKGGQAEEVYFGGCYRVYTPYDDETPSGTEVPFESWVQSKVCSIITNVCHGELQDQLKNLTAENEETLGQLLELTEALRRLADIAPSYSELSDAIRLFDSAARSHLIGQMDTEAESIWIEFINRDSWKRSTIFDSRDEWLVFKMASLLLPAKLPSSLKQAAQSALIEHLKPAPELTSQSLLYLCRDLVGMGAAFRALVHEHLMPQLGRSELHHTLAVTFAAYPAEARRYIEEGLNLETENVSLMVHAESFYLQQNELAKVQELRSRLDELKMPKADSTVNVQHWIDRYTQLVNDYQYYNPRSNTNETGPELMKLEARLNAHWMAQLPPSDSLARTAVERELCKQSRFLSAGSAGYVGWLRNEQRYQEVVDMMMPMSNQLELCRLRHKTCNMRFEYFIGNGISSFLDSQEPRHIEQALELIDAMETVIPEWTNHHSLYALACVAARAGRCGRALDYIRDCIAKGGSFWDMVRDTDFQNLWEHPEFVQLKEEQLLALK